MAWDPASYAAHAGFVPALGGAVLDLLAPITGERILDLGCGDGVLTEKLVAAGATVTGVDADPAMVASAVEKGLDARVGDGRRLVFDADFDAVFTNAALHWMGEPAPVVAGVFRALRPAGASSESSAVTAISPRSASRSAPSWSRGATGCRRSRRITIPPPKRLRQRSERAGLGSTAASSSHAPRLSPVA